MFETHNVLGHLGVPLAEHDETAVIESLTSRCRIENGSVFASSLRTLSEGLLDTSTALKCRSFAGETRSVPSGHRLSSPPDLIGVGIPFFLHLPPTRKGGLAVPLPFGPDAWESELPALPGRSGRRFGPSASVPVAASACTGVPTPAVTIGRR